MPWLVWVFGYMAMVASPAIGDRLLNFDGMTYLRERLGSDLVRSLETGKNAYTKQTYNPQPVPLRNPFYDDEELDWMAVGKRALSALSRFKPLTSAFSRRRPFDGDEGRRDVRYTMRSFPRLRPFERAPGAPLRYGKR